MERSGVGAGELCGLIHMRVFVCLCAGSCLPLDMIVDNHTPHTFCVCNCAVLARAFTLVCECECVCACGVCVCVCVCVNINFVHIFAGPSQAVLMTKMGMKPFAYGIKVTHFFDGEAMIDPAILDIDDSDIIECFKQAMSKVAAVGLQIGYPVAPAVPHMMVTAFRNLVALTLDTEIDFKEAAEIKDRIANPDKYGGGGGGGGGGAAPAAAAAAAPAAAAAAPEPEEDEDMGFSLFD